jgi:hypothetical protein
VQDSNLVDLPMVGYPFTWVKGQGGEDFKEERLDRAMATQSWNDIFPHSQLHNVISHRSDHFPILLKLCMADKRRGAGEFRFENVWLMGENFDDVVIGGWEKSLNGGVLNKLKSCTEDMNDWGRKLRNKYRVEIEECREELERLRGSVQTSQVVRYEEVRNRMGILLAQEEAFWKQRAKVIWLKDGDTNSKFFHATSSSKRRRNLVTKLKRDDGVEVMGQQELCGVASSYFTHLFANN